MTNHIWSEIVRIDDTETIYECLDCPAIMDSDGGVIL